MNILLISDIHANYPALEAVAARHPPADFDAVFNCGDSTVYAPFPNETLDWLRAHNVMSIRGNTDDRVVKLLKGKTFKRPKKAEKRVMYTCTAATLTQQNASFLINLKKKKVCTLEGHDIGLFHGSPAHHEEFLFPHTPKPYFKKLATQTECSIIITGHSHTPYHKHIAGVHFINPGSVGRMFDGNPDASYATLHLNKNEIKVHLYRCAYDIDRVVQRLSEQRLPDIYGEMYRVGQKLN